MDEQKKRYDTGKYSLEKNMKKNTDASKIKRKKQTVPEKKVYSVEWNYTANS